MAICSNRTRFWDSSYNIHVLGLGQEKKDTTAAEDKTFAGLICLPNNV